MMITERMRKDGIPVTTAYQSRLRIFQATRRPRAVDQIFVTPWGEVRIKGRLGQQHADVLESILWAGQKPKDLGEGRFKILVDPAEVRRASRQDGSTLQRITEELMEALVEIVQPERLAGIGHLIDHISWARRSDGSFLTRDGPGGAFPGERRLWRVELGKGLCQILAKDLWIQRDPRPIASLRHGISQAVARHVLTHKKGSCVHWSADTLITMVAGEMSSQDLRNRRRDLLADREALAELGVRV